MAATKSLKISSLVNKFNAGNFRTLDRVENEHPYGTRQWSVYYLRLVVDYIDSVDWDELNILIDILRVQEDKERREMIRKALNFKDQFKFHRSKVILNSIIHDAGYDVS